MILGELADDRVDRKAFCTSSGFDGRYPSEFILESRFAFHAGRSTLCSLKCRYAGVLLQRVRLLSDTQVEIPMT